MKRLPFKATSELGQDLGNCCNLVACPPFAAVAAVAAAVAAVADSVVAAQQSLKVNLGNGTTL